MKKRLDEITTEEIQRIPVWEHWTENDIEFIRPTEKVSISESDNVGYIVLTNFKLNNGQQVVGFSSPQDPSGIDYIQPTIISEYGLFKIYWNTLTEMEMKKELNKLRLMHSEVFPIEFRTTIKSDGKFLSGIINDFNTHKLNVA